VSKARLVITAVIIEGRSQSEVAREYGVSQGWISRLVKRYRLEGEAAFEPQSRRPRTSPTRLAQARIDLIIKLRAELASKGLDNGPATISWHLRHHHGVTVGGRQRRRPKALDPAHADGSYDAAGRRPEEQEDRRPVQLTIVTTGPTCPRRPGWKSR
jgi:transposase-like protein